MDADPGHEGAAAYGRLRIYLGYAPGGGTTCALLGEGHERAAHGVDVAVASVQTHGRAHTLALLKGLEVIPPAMNPFRGATVQEMNLGAVLDRRPQVALVDDFAHRNAPGARHPGRWQDVEALLAAGIDVISTVSIGHLESLTDVVEKITGSAPRQTVPDPLVRAAAEVELVDVVPDALRARMADGHIYPQQQAEAALDGWFRTGNLSALRELALLWLAATLASDPQRCHPRVHVPGGGDGWERVVVALNGGPEGETLIRRAARIAARSGGDLLAVHVVRPGVPAAADLAALAAQTRLVESMGGRYRQLADEDIPAALLAFAHTEGATQLVVGTGRGAWLAGLRPRTSICSRVIGHGGGIDLHVVSCPRTSSGVPPAAGERNQTRRTVMEHNTSPARVRSAVRWARGQAAPGRGRHRRGLNWLASAAVAAAALIVTGCGSSGSSGSGSSGSGSGSGQSASTTSVVKTAKIGGVTVLTNAKGDTLYTFAIDGINKSKCNGTCSHYWPPEKGPVTATGIKGTFGTIKRSDGTTQETWNGHPLYTYIGDTAPGQAKGNGLNLSGGVWHEAAVSGAAASSQSSSSSGGGGY